MVNYIRSDYRLTNGARFDNIVYEAIGYLVQKLKCCIMDTESEIYGKDCAYQLI